MKKWEVMKAHEEGAVIEIKVNPNPEWATCSDPIWDWADCEYRVKPAEPEVDWKNVKIDTPVLCRDKGEVAWKKRYFAGATEQGQLLAWAEGATSRTKLYNSKAWAEMKLDLEAEAIINWIPNTGEKPSCSEVLVRLRSGEVDASAVERFVWAVKGFSDDIVEYAVLKK